MVGVSLSSNHFYFCISLHPDSYKLVVKKADVKRILAYIKLLPFRVFLLFCLFMDIPKRFTVLITESIGVEV